MNLESHFLKRLGQSQLKAFTNKEPIIQMHNLPGSPYLVFHKSSSIYHNYPPIKMSHTWFKPNDIGGSWHGSWIHHIQSQLGRYQKFPLLCPYSYADLAFIIRLLPWYLRRSNITPSAAGSCADSFRICWMSGVVRDARSIWFVLSDIMNVHPCAQGKIILHKIWFV